MQNILEFFKLRYFFLENDAGIDSFQFLDQLKVWSFIILFSKADEKQKIDALVYTISREAKNEIGHNKDISDHDVSASDIDLDLKYYKREPNTLRVLSFLFSGAVLPFAHYFEDILKKNDFSKYAISNSDIYFDFARFMCSNYIFNLSNSEEYPKKFKKKKQYTDREFMILLKKNYNYVFEPKSIRKKFLEFWNSDKERALKSTAKNSSKNVLGSMVGVLESQDQSIHSNFFNVDDRLQDRESVVKMKATKIAKLRERSKPKDDLNSFTNAKFSNNSNSKDELAGQRWQEKFIESNMKGGQKRYKEDLDDESHLYEVNDRDDSYIGFADQDETHYRMDDTINITRKSNLSVDHNTLENEEDKTEFGFEMQLRENFGEGLLNKLQIIFERNVRDGVYFWNKPECKLNEMFQRDTNNREDEDLLLSNQRFSHSFRYSMQNRHRDEDGEYMTAEAYLKAVFDKNIKMQDLRDFYYDDYRGPGMVNAYFRLLEVYNELCESKQEHYQPGQEFVKIKLFETNMLETFNQELHHGEFSESLNEELAEAFEYDLLIIPIFIHDDVFLFVIEMRESDPEVKLFSTVAGEDFLHEMSELILNLLSHIFILNDYRLDENSVDATNETVGGIPDILKIAEHEVLELPEEALEVSDSSHKHKILERLLYIYLS